MKFILKELKLFIWIITLLTYSNAFSQNDLCSGAISLTPNTTCVNTTGSFSGSGNAGTTTSCSSTALQDVWYSFVATDPTMSILLSNVNGLNLGMEILTGTCTGTSFACDNSSLSTSSEVYLSNTFTVGQTYYVRVYHLESGLSTSNFTICVKNYPTPANDLCSGAISLTSNTNCVNTTGSFGGSANTGTTTSCSATALQDVWYSFVATDPTMSVYLSNVNSIDLGMEILTGSCTGTSFVCDNSSVSLTSELYQSNTFTVGQTYYVRVYHLESVLLTSNFTICVQNYPTPANDLCSGAISLTPTTNCGSTTGSFSGSGSTGITTSCSSTALQDVWYRFVATDPTMSVTLSNGNSVDLGMEIVTGSCAGTSFACDNNSVSLTSEFYQSNTFTVGQTYYVRVYHSDSALLTSNFTICVENPTLSTEDFSIDEIKIYPNPAQDIIIIDLDNELALVEIYSLQGQKILTSNKKEINVSNLNSGIYLVKIKDVNGSVASQKFVKN